MGLVLVCCLCLDFWIKGCVLGVLDCMVWFVFDLASCCFLAALAGFGLVCLRVGALGGWCNICSRCFGWCVFDLGGVVVWCFRVLVGVERGWCFRFWLVCFVLVGLGMVYFLVLDGWFGDSCGFGDFLARFLASGL